MTARVDADNLEPAFSVRICPSGRKDDMFWVYFDSVALDIGPLSPPTSWDFGPRLYHERGTGR